MQTTATTKEMIGFKSKTDTCLFILFILVLFLSTCLPTHLKFRPFEPVTGSLRHGGSGVLHCFSKFGDFFWAHSHAALEVSVGAALEFARHVNAQAGETLLEMVQVQWLQHALCGRGIGMWLHRVAVKSVAQIVQLVGRDFFKRASESVGGLVQVYWHYRGGSGRRGFERRQAQLEPLEFVVMVQHALAGAPVVVLAHFREVLSLVRKSLAEFRELHGLQAYLVNQKLVGTAWRKRSKHHQRIAMK